MNPRQSGHKFCKVVKVESKIVPWSVFHRLVLTHECGEIEVRCKGTNRDGTFKPAPKRVRCYRKGE